MEQHKELEDLNKQSLDKVEEYLKNKKDIGSEDHEKLHEAKTEWQNSYNKLMQVLMYLETLEI